MEDTIDTATCVNRSTGFSLFGCLAALILSTAAVTGCAQPAVNTAAAMASARPIDRSADHYEWIKRLQATPPAENVPNMATPGSQVSYPISVPMAAGAQYALVINQSLRMAWLHSSNGTTGPWPLDQPDVTHLLKSVAIPPTNSAAAQ